MQRRARGLMAGVLLAFVAFSAPAEMVDQVAATVGAEVILLSEIMSEIGPEIQELRETSPNAEAFQRAVSERVRATLDQAIESKILYRQAQLAGLEVDDKVIEERLEEFREPYASTEEFLKELEDAGLTMNELRTRIRKQSLAMGMAARKTEEFSDEIVVSEVDVAKYYDEHKDEFYRKERVLCRQIFLPIEQSSPSKELQRARMAEIQEELAAGAAFDRLAEAFSKGAGAEDGGLLGWVERGDLVQPLEEAVFNATIGSVTDVIESEFGLHLLKAEERQEAGLATLDEVRQEIEPKLRTQAATERYNKWMKELRKRSRVRIFL